MLTDICWFSISGFGGGGFGSSFGFGGSLFGNDMMDPFGGGSR